MGSTNKTKILQLSQWIGTDQPKRIDFNSDNEKIENVVKGLYNNISFSNGQLSITKVDGTNQRFSVSVNASDTVSGTLTKNEVKELATNKINELVTDTRIKEQALAKLKEYGIGALKMSDMTRDWLQNKLPTGLYYYTRGINNKTTCGLNFYYDGYYGVQLAITEEEKPRLFLRQIYGGFKPWVEAHTTANLEPATVDEIWAGVSNG